MLLFPVPLDDKATSCLRLMHGPIPFSTARAQSFLYLSIMYGSTHFPYWREGRRGSKREMMMMMKMKLRSRRLFKRISFKAAGGGGNDNGGSRSEIEWEMRPGGMLVQKREGGGGGEAVIMVRVSTGFHQHEICIGATATFGDLKMVVSLATGLEPREQRLLFKGKEREDEDHLHMVGVRDKDKVMLLEDPAIKERKLLAMQRKSQAMGGNLVASLLGC